MSASLRQAIAGLVLLVSAVPAGAAEWKHELAPYLWGSAMDGTVGAGDVVAETQLSFSDILDNLEFGFMGAYRASRDRYSITVDAIYMGLGATEKGPGGVLKADNCRVAAGSSAVPSRLAATGEDCGTRPGLGELLIPCHSIRAFAGRAIGSPAGRPAWIDNVVSAR